MTLTDQAGHTTTFDYDAVGQLTSQSSPFGSLTSSFDPVGNLIGQVRSTGLTTDYTHDAVGRVTQIAHHTPVVPDEVSAASWVAPVASPTDALQPCPAGEAEAAPGDEPEHVTSYLDRRTTPAAGDRAGCKKADEWGAARDFPTLGKESEAGESIVFDYTYDPTGNVTSELETLGSHGTTRTSYLYDDLDRLTQSLSTDGVINGYAYDPVGNRTGWVSSKAPDTGQPLVVASQFNPAGQVTSQQRLRAGQADTSVVFEHDRNGNRVAETVRGPEGASTTRSTFTSTGRIASISEGAGTPHRVSAEFAYDGLGRQLTASHESWAGHSTQAQVWDGLQVIQQSTIGGGSGGVATVMRDAAGQVAVQSAGLGDRTAAGSLLGRGATWSLHDVQGSTIATTTATGRVTDLVDYSDFGIPQHASAGFTAVMGFTGESTDARTGLHHYFARSYDSFTATWTSPDSYRGTLTDPGSQGRYGYVGGNPTSMVDVLGFRAMAMHDGGSSGGRLQRMGGGVYSSTGYPSYATAVTRTIVRQAVGEKSSAGSSGCGRASCASRMPDRHGDFLQGLRDFAQDVGARIVGTAATLSVGVAASVATRVGLSLAAARTPGCWVLAFACAVAVNAASLGAGGGAALTVGATVGTWLRAGLSSGPRDSQEAALGMWMLGIAPGNSLTYDGDSDLVGGLRQQPEVQNAREAIATGSQTRSFDYSARTDDLFGTTANLLRDGCTLFLWSSSCGGLGNQTKLGVGSWTGDAVANPDGTITFTARNDISLRSALGVLPFTHDFLDGVTPSSGPFSTVRQEISWTEGR